MPKTINGVKRTRIDTAAKITSSMAVIRDNPKLMDEPKMQLPLLVKNLPVPESYSSEWEYLHAHPRQPVSQPERARYDEELLLRIHFGGLHVLCTQTPNGRMVLAAGHPGTGALGEVLETLSPDEYQNSGIEKPRPWEELVDALRERSGTPCTA